MRIDAAAAGSSQADQAPHTLGSREDFMTLLIAQLKVQDPMSPMDPAEFMTQLAQLQTVAELSTISSLLTQSYLDRRLDSSLALIGREVKWHDPTTGEELSGRVESVSLANGQARLIVNGDEVAPGSVTSVS